MASVLSVLALGAAACSGSPSRSASAVGPAAGKGPGQVATAAGYDGDLDRLGALLTSRPLPATLTAAAPAPAVDAPPSGPPYTTGPRPGSPVVVPPPALPPGDGTVYAVGDSVLLGAANYLPTTLTGWDVRIDGRVGRRMPEGLSIVQENRASLGQVAVVVLGHNYGGGGSFSGLLDQLLFELRRVQRVVLVTVAEWSPAQLEVNRAIWASTFRYGNVVVADWAGTVAANPQFLVSDRVHPNSAGQVALANLIAVLVGPAPPREGVIPPPPKILPIPDVATPSPTLPPGVSTTTSTAPSGTSVPGTTEPPGSTTTTAPTTVPPPDSTTTTSGPPEPVVPPP